jgi:hypothetical protein
VNLNGGTLLPIGFAGPEFGDFLIKSFDASDWMAIMQRLWSPELLNKNAKTPSVYYIRTSWKFIQRVPEAAVHFYNKNMYRLFWDRIMRTMTADVPCLKLLGIFNQQYATYKKGDKRTINGRKKLADFYRKNGFSVVEFLKRSKTKGAHARLGRSGYFHFLWSMISVDERCLKEYQNAVFDQGATGWISSCDPCKGMAKLLCQLAVADPIPNAIRFLLGEFDTFRFNQYPCVGRFCKAFLAIGKQKTSALDDFRPALIKKVTDAAVPSILGDGMAKLVVECFTQQEAEKIMNTGRILIAQDLQRGRGVNQDEVRKYRERVMKGIRFVDAIAQKFQFPLTQMNVCPEDIYALAQHFASGGDTDDAATLIQFCRL